MCAVCACVGLCIYGLVYILDGVFFDRCFCLLVYMGLSPQAEKKVFQKSKKALLNNLFL